MPVELHPYSGDHRDSFFAILSRAFADVPDCYPVANEAATAIQVAKILPGTENDSTAGPLLQRQLLLALNDGEAVGFVDFGLYEPDQGAKPVGVIRYLWFDNGARAAGEALLDCAESTLAQAGAATISAFSVPYLPFHKHLSNCSGHLRALFTLRGYEITAGEVYITWENFSEHAEHLRALAGQHLCIMPLCSLLMCMEGGPAALLLVHAPLLVASTACITGVVYPLALAATLVSTFSWACVSRRVSTN